LILPKVKNCSVSDLCTAGLDTIALRVPSHPVAQDLLRRAEVPIAAPSANKSGVPSPTAPVHVKDSLGDKVDMILAAGKCTIGLESTVLDLSGEEPLLLRPGAVTLNMIREILPTARLHVETSDKPKSPGQLLKHYAPSIPVRLNAVDINKDEALLAFGSIKFMGIKTGGAAQDLPETQICNLSENGDLHEAASNLFAFMRQLDRPEHARIAVMNIPDNSIGAAINDRLRRAAAATRA
jgi:L-threonylcarbamoyladenylate synthase